ncbi:hypothetical protein [Niastella populi]|uniref:Plasmid stabilization protein n=1 Tax=Niastella populi TaxID=550983 RepID=A0A1V9FZC8_9BACT|nr:hypothetical protein [Niastella populi]OQP63596.1 hypothetical protein A4R26_16590 [Niastella populi]
MGRRKVVVKQSVADIAWYIESKGLIATADKFVDKVYDHFLNLADNKKSHPICREPECESLGYKCTPYKKKNTIVFIESATELVICEFIPSKLIHW